MPSPGDPQNLNRFGDVRNNPLRFTDPTGHHIPDDDPVLPSSSPPEPPPETDDDTLRKEAGIILEGVWTAADKAKVAEAVRRYVQKLGMARFKELLGGPVTGKWGTPPYCGNAFGCAPPPTLFSDGHTVYLNPGFGDKVPDHELAHIIDWWTDFSWDYPPLTDYAANPSPFPLSSGVGDMGRGRRGVGLWRL